MSSLVDYLNTFNGGAGVGDSSLTTPRPINKTQPVATAPMPPSPTNYPGGSPSFNEAGPAYTAPPVSNSQNAAGRGVSAQQYYNDYLRNFGVNLRQSGPEADWQDLVKAMNTEGYGATLDQRSDNLHKGIMLNGQFVKLLNGNDQPIWLPGGDQPAAGGGGGEFTDPWGSSMEQLTKAYIASLQNDPTRNALAEYIKELTAGKATARERAAALSGDLTNRATSIRNTPLYTDQQTEAMRVKATDQLNRRRQATLANDREKLYARGFAPTSGLQQGADQATNTSFNNMEGGINSDLLVAGAQGEAEQQRYADQLTQLANQALQGGDATALGMQSQIADLENQTNQDALNRQREAIAATAGPLGLISQRLGGAQGVLAGSNPAQSSNSMLQMLQFLQGLDQSKLSNSNAQWGGLAQILQLLGIGFN